MLNKRNILIGFGILILTVVVSFFSLVPINKNYEPTEWMAGLSDDTLLTEMSIPGTHDSGATHSIFDVSGKCQDLNIDEQLNIGVRFFDLRLQLVNDEFNIVHSFVDQRLKFVDALDDICSYVREHNSEFIIISIKKEADSVNSLKKFEDVLKTNLSQYDDVISYSGLLPQTLKEARGKVLIISRYDATFGVKANNGWQDSTTFELGSLYVQDNYCITDLEVKKNDILSAMEYSKLNNNKLVLNFTSCYLDGAFPPTYAGTSALTINPWLENHINNSDGNLGIIITDFITESLAKSIYERNYV